MVTKLVETPPVRREPMPVERTQRPVPPPAQRSRWWVQLLVLAALVVGGYFATPYVREMYDRWAEARAQRMAPPKRDRVIPVVTATARQGDMDLYLNGLGTVTAFNSVTLRSRIDGELQKVMFREGQQVKAGDLLFQIDPRPFEVQLIQAEAQLNKDLAGLKSQKLDLERYANLLQTKAIALQQYEAQAALVAQTEAMVKADEAQIANVRLQLQYCRITAPIPGRIGLRVVDQGNYIRANDVAGLAVITQLQPIAVTFTVPQDEITRLQRRSAGSQALTAEVFDRDLTNKLATGTLDAVDNQVDPTTGTLRLKAVFENEDAVLFPRQFVNVRLLIETLRNVVIVPSAAVQRGPESATFVYVVKPDETVELRDIELGESENDQTVITKGLAADERVVTDGVDKLLPGKKVTSRPPAKPGVAGAATSEGAQRKETL